jgi:hypothetical protein
MKQFLLLVAVIAVVFGVLLVSLWVLDLIKLVELQNDLRKIFRSFERGRSGRGLDLVLSQNCAEGIAGCDFGHLAHLNGPATKKR